MHMQAHGLAGLEGHQCRTQMVMKKMIIGTLQEKIKKDGLKSALGRVGSKVLKWGWHCWTRADDRSDWLHVNNHIGALLKKEKPYFVVRLKAIIQPLAHPFMHAFVHSAIRIAISSNHILLTELLSSSTPFLHPHSLQTYG